MKFSTSDRKKAFIGKMVQKLFEYYLKCVQWIGLSTKGGPFYPPTYAKWQKCALVGNFRPSTCLSWNSMGSRWIIITGKRS